jgi:hypothetical protein
MIKTELNSIELNSDVVIGKLFRVQRRNWYLRHLTVGDIVMITKTRRKTSDLTKALADYYLVDIIEPNGELMQCSFSQSSFNYALRKVGKTR